MTTNAALLNTEESRCAIWGGARLQLLPPACFLHVPERKLFPCAYGLHLLADIDGDSDLDLFICRNGGTGAVYDAFYINDGSGGFTERTCYIGTFTTSYCGYGKSYAAALGE